MGTPTEKDRPRIVIDVPADFAADFLTEDLPRPPDMRPVLPLRLGETDLGLWRVVSIQTERVDSDYNAISATLAPMWP